MINENGRRGMTHDRGFKGLLTGMLLGVLLVGTSGCYKHVFNVGSGAPSAPVAEEEWRHHWLWGLVSPDNVLELSEVCSSGNATIEAEQHFLNGLVAALTGGIYSPTTVRVRCADGTASLDLDAEEVARIVSAPELLVWVGEAMPDRLREVTRAQRVFRAE